MCKYQQRFGLDVQCSALVHNFNNILSNGHLYRAGQSMNSLPSQILERCRQFFMRPLLTIIFFLFYLTSSAQKYSNVITDIAITNFMTWLFKSDTSFKAVRHIDNDILKLHSDNFITVDSTTLNNYQFAQNIFSKPNNLIQYFNEDDANYFVQQINQQRKDKWKLRIKGIKLFDTIELINNRVDKVLYSYSLPLFSTNKKYVIIIEAFFCGLVCGGGEYSLYERQSDSSWKKVKTFNQWAE